MLYIPATAEASKRLRFRLVKLLHQLNIQFMYVTLEVSKLLRSKLVRLLHF